MQKERKIQLKQKRGEGMSDLESKELVIYEGKLVWIELCMSASGQWIPVILSALVGGEDIHYVTFERFVVLLRTCNILLLLLLIFSSTLIPSLPDLRNWEILFRFFRKNSK